MYVVRKYSSVPNKRGGCIERFGGNFVEKCVVHQINKFRGFSFCISNNSQVCVSFQSFKHTSHIFSKRLIKVHILIGIFPPNNKRDATFIRNTRVRTSC